MQGHMIPSKCIALRRFQQLKSQKLHWIDSIAMLVESMSKSSEALGPQKPWGNILVCPSPFLIESSTRNEETAPAQQESMANLHMAKHGYGSMAPPLVKTSNQIRLKTRGSFWVNHYTTQPKYLIRIFLFWIHSQLCQETATLRSMSALWSLNKRLRMSPSPELRCVGFCARELPPSEMGTSPSSHNAPEPRRSRSHIHFFFRKNGQTWYSDIQWYLSVIDTSHLCKR